MTVSRIACAMGLILVVLVSSAAAQLTVQGKTHLGGKASSIVQLTTSVAPAEFKALELVVPGVAAAPTTFTLPPKSVLIVTDIVLYRATGSGEALAQLTDGAAQRFALTVPDGERIRAVSLGSGMVFPGTPAVLNGGGTGIITIQMTGYLVKNK